MKMLNRLLNRAQKRFVHSRPGSVLILVVALLVLMALIGTAYMTMAQFDRASAAQHSFNTEVDLLLDGMINLVKGTVTSDVFVQSNFRPGNPTYNNNPPAVGPQISYGYFNSVGLDAAAAAGIGGQPGDVWIGSRVPELLTPPAGSIGWPFITAALVGGGTFDTPYWPTAGAAIRYSLRNSVIPGATAVAIDGNIQPAFLNAYLDPTTHTFIPVMAADTDGDGIADAGLVKLPVGTIDGITYYGAIRIVDNCAAINASIALRPNATTALAPTPPAPPALPTVPFTAMPGDFSPVNLDMEGMLIANTPGQPPLDLYGPGTVNQPGLLQYRFNNVTPTAAAYDETTGLARTDFVFMADPHPTNGRALCFNQQWMQLGRRLDNPGNVASGTGSTSKYQALPISESIALTKGFILHDPNVATWQGSSSILEQKMPNTMFTYALSTPYAPSDTATWFANNFNYAAGVNNTGGIGGVGVPMRALLVARNPVSNFVPQKFTDRGPYSAATAYNFGDSVTMLTTATGRGRFVCIRQGSKGTAPLLPSADPNFKDANWAFEPWATAPTKTSVNTATFQQLYAAYWAVMADHYNGGWVPPLAAAVTDLGQHMFRNPVRAPGTGTVLTAQQVMWLRAALAAVNTMDLRDSDDDVTSRTVFLPDSIGNPKYQAIVYGAEREPYITQVYARNDANATNDWIGVEVFNPYPVGSTPILLKNWHFATLTRTATLTLTSIATITSPVSIAPQHRVLFLSKNPPTNVMLPTTYPPNTDPPVVIGALTKAFGNELVLLRPRRADGTSTGNQTAANNTYLDTKISEMVPVDSYDLTNLPPKAATAAVATEWQYIRPSDPTARKNWHFIYPGVWDTALPVPTATPMLKGTKVVATGALPTQWDISMTFGFAQSAPANGVDPNYTDVPIQIANWDFGGPLKAKSATGNYFPFGSFARDGDILQVPFIGSYAIFVDNGVTPNGTPTRGALLEMNAVTMDSVMATSADKGAGDTTTGIPIASTTVVAENIGRFAPIDSTDAAAGGAAVDDFGAVQTSWRYHWCMRLFDYLTTLSPQDDYSPNVDPFRADPNYSTTPATPYRYLPLVIPNAVANVTPATAAAPIFKGNAYYPNAGNEVPTFNANSVTEETAPVNGLVNINTAQWRVLAAVPWKPATVATYAADNAIIAQAIVKYRDTNDGSGTHGHGPFKSIFELNEVPVAGTKLRDILANTNSFDFGVAQGNLSPLDTANYGVDNVMGDFESRFNTITRVSNLITTRSDSYTAYILIQGWRNAETPNPHLVVQRRAAIILDRSAVTPSNPTPSVINVPLN